MTNLILAIDARKAREGAAEWASAVDSVQKTASKADGAVQHLDKTLDEIKTSAAESRRAIAQNVTTLQALAAETSRTSSNVSSITQEMGKLVASGNKTDAMLEDLSDELRAVRLEAERAAEQGLDKFEHSERKVADTSLNLQSIMTSLFAAIAAHQIISRAVDQMVAFEEGLTNVTKAANLTEQETESLGKGITELSTRIPVTTKELLDLAAEAGQLGVRGVGNLLKFTETAATMGKSTALASKDAVQGLSNIIHATGEPIEDVDRLGSAIVALASNTRASESVITDNAAKIAASTSLYRVTAVEIAAIAAVIGDLNLNSGLASKTIEKTFRSMDDAIREGGTKLRNFANIAGQSEKQFADVFRNDAVAALVLFLNGLKQLSAAGGDVEGTLKALELGGDANNRILPILANNTTLLTKALETSAEGFKKNTALSDGAKQSFSTLGSEIQTFGNVVKAAVPDGLTDGLAALVGTATSVIRILSGMGDAEDHANTAAVILARSIVVLSTVLTGLIAVKVVSFIAALVVEIGTLTSALIVLEVAIRRNPLTFWIGLITAAATALSFVLVPATADATDEIKGLHDRVVELQDRLERFKEIKAALERSIAVGDSAEKIQVLNSQIRELTKASVDARAKLNEVPDAVVSGLAGVLGEKPEDLARQFVDQFIQGLQTGNSDKAVGDFFDRVLTFETGARASKLIQTIRKSISDPLNSELRKAATLARLELEKIIDVDNLPATTGIDLIEAKIIHLKETIAATDLPVTDTETKAALEREKKAIENAHEALRSFTDSVHQEYELAGLSAAQRERVIKLRQAENLAVKAGVQNLPIYLAMLGAELDLTDQLNEAAAQRAREDARRAAGLRSFEDYVARIHDETRLAALSNDEREEELAVRGAMDIALKGNVTNYEAYIEKIREDIREQQRLRRVKAEGPIGPLPGPENDPNHNGDYGPFIIPDSKAEAAKKRLDEMTDGLKFERDMLGSSNEEREKAIYLRELEAAATEAQVDNVGELVKKYGEEFDEFQRLRSLNELGESLGNTIGSAFEDAVFHVTNLREAINALGRDLARQVFNQMVTQPISNFATTLMQGFLTPAPSAKGNVFSGGSIVPFYSGGLVTGPTMFPMAHGKTGLMGEKGVEAIMPLERGPDGKLGVRAAGGGGHSSTVNNYKMVISTPNADSFRRSERQIWRGLNKKRRG